MKLTSTLKRALPLAAAGAALLLALIPLQAQQRNGWEPTCTQGGSGRPVPCDSNSGVTEISQPKGSIGKESNAPCDAESGPAGQLKKSECTK